MPVASRAQQNGFSTPVYCSAATRRLRGYRQGGTYRVVPISTAAQKSRESDGRCQGLLKNHLRLLCSKTTPSDESHARWFAGSGVTAQDNKRERQGGHARARRINRGRQTPMRRANRAGAPALPGPRDVFDIGLHGLSAPALRLLVNAVQGARAREETHRHPPRLRL